MTTIIGQHLFDQLLGEAANNPRLRVNFDLRDNESDGSQRMLNALQPGTRVPVHRHLLTSETIIVLKGHVDEVFFDNDGNETERVRLGEGTGNSGIQVPLGRWHTLDVHEPSVIIEFKNGAYAPLSPDEIL